ncbi:lipoyltransferase [Vararia minispora EC-137]|uniref:Lipoyltransferase n=1 Tax=Vararia minispora EC-137 TaxID=1314806 RepID=A0ACB8Q777_9AGAM|nr:lipoyltransferase [Vararia minispora EC-137]
MSLPPVFYHHFVSPLPYARTLRLQQALYALQYSKRSASSPYREVLFLLEHRPVYTGGRRQSDGELASERLRLTKLGADFMLAERGGQLTYHGPGQLVGYPLLDLGRVQPAVTIREYICKLQNALTSHLREAHGLDSVQSENTGVFLDASTKIASIGVQVRHRLTSHGFSLNITNEPRAWFDEVVACGLPDVHAGSIESATGRPASVAAEVPGVVSQLKKALERDMVPLDMTESNELVWLVQEMEADAERFAAEVGPCYIAPGHR